MGLLGLRIGVGATLFAHGAQKLLGWFGGGGPEKTGQAFGGMGFVPGGRNALLAGASEAGSGAASSTRRRWGLVGTALSLTGPGRLSLDHATGEILNRPWMRVVAFLGAAGSAAYLISQRSGELQHRSATDTA